MSIKQQIKAIESLRGRALRAKFQEVIGAKTKSNNRPYLIKRIRKALEEKAEKTKAKPSRRARKTRERDPRLPKLGTVLEREHEGKKIRVTVLEDGFRFAGKTYRSLSTVAREATGTIWNGFLFFRLIPYAKREKRAA